jgi:hypothetical protein
LTNDRQTTTIGDHQCVSQLVEIAESGASETAVFDRVDSIVDEYLASVRDSSGTANERPKLINAFRDRTPDTRLKGPILDHIAGLTR